MALDTYANIKTAIENWLNRVGDTTISGQADDFLALAEQRLSEDLRIRAIEADLSVTIASGTATVPSDFLELKHARIDGDPTFPLELKESDWLYRKFPTRSSTSKPEYIAIDGETFVFGPYPDSNYTIVGIYHAKPAVLSDANITNAWTTNVSDALLFAAIAEAADYINSNDQVVKWEAKYERIKDRYLRSEKRKTRRGARVSYN